MLEEKILSDYKEAMKARDTVKISLLSCLRAEIMNSALAKKKNNLDDGEVLAVIKKQIKQHQDSIEQFKKGNRNDLAEKEIKELAILELYLPPQLSEAEVIKAIEEIIVQTAASGPKDMGKVMKEAQSRIGASADGRLISEIVKSKLANPN